MIKIYDYIYISLLIISISGATTFARGISNYTSASFYIYILLSILTLIFHKINVSKTLRKFFFVCSAVLIFAIYLSFAFNDKMIGFIALTLPLIFHTYVLIVTFKERFIIIFEKIIVFMTVGALVFWVGNILFTSTIEALVKTFQFSEAYGIAYGENDSNVSANIIFYTLSNYSSIDQDDGVFSYVLRNAGFAWEAGAFSSILLIAMYCNVVINKFRFNRSLLVLIIGLFSAQSTTGYLLFCIFISFFIYNQSKKIFIKSSIFIALFVALIFSSNIVSNKFDVELNTQNISLQSLDSYSYRERYSPRRWLSFQIDFVDFLHNPLGSGMGQYTWHHSVADNIHTISGIGKIFSYYGLLGVLAFFYFLIRSSVLFSQKFVYKGKYVLAMLLFGILISYDFTLKPIFAYFWLYSLFMANQFKSHRLENSA